MLAGLPKLNRLVLTFKNIPIINWCDCTCGWFLAHYGAF